MKKQKNFEDYEEDFLSTSSLTEMTGLIPAAPTEPDEIDNYEELYPFLPQVAARYKDEE